MERFRVLVLVTAISCFAMGCEVNINSELSASPGPTPTSAVSCPAMSESCAQAGPGCTTNYDPALDENGCQISCPVIVCDPQSTPDFNLHLTTTHNRIESAGVPFAYILQVKDRDSNTLVTSYNDTVSLQITTHTDHSWTGRTATKPAAVVDCQFVNGVCTIQNTCVAVGAPNAHDKPCALMDSRQATTIDVTDPDGHLEHITAASITVSAHSPDTIGIADAPSGPQNGAHYLSDPDSAVTGVHSFPLSQGHQDYYTVATDAAGNWIADSSATWQVTSGGSSGYLADYLGITLPTVTDHVTFNPSGAGNGATLTISLAGLNSTSLTVNVTP